MSNTYPCSNCNMDEGSPVCLQDYRCGRARDVRPEGWYFVRFENWDGGHDDWCPAWWNGMYWGSYRYSGIPDSRAIVGDKIVMPNK